MKKDETGHEALMDDIVELLDRGNDYEFHDFKGKAAMPKTDLVLALTKMIENCKGGKYDN